MRFVVAGIVREEGTGHGMPGLAVQVQTSEGARVLASGICDQEGRFELAFEAQAFDLTHRTEAPGAVDVVVTATPVTGTREKARPIALAAQTLPLNRFEKEENGLAARGLEFQIDCLCVIAALRGFYTTVGMVCDRATGFPVPGARVQALDFDLLKPSDPMGEAVTDSNGKFRILTPMAAFASEVLVSEGGLPDIRLQVSVKDRDGNWAVVHHFSDDVIRFNHPFCKPIKLCIDQCWPVIVKVGGMAAGSIGADGLANGLSANGSFEAQNSPFGGQVDIHALHTGCEHCTRFKIEFGQWDDDGEPPTTLAPIMQTWKEWQLQFIPTPPFYKFVPVDRSPSEDGFYSILCGAVQNGIFLPWQTGGLNGKYRIKLTIEDAHGHQFESAPVDLVLDNTAPEAVLNLTNLAPCADVQIGTVIEGDITGTDAHFYSYRLRYESSAASGTLLARTYTGTGDSGDSALPFTWDTSGLPACGYRLVLDVWDRTIVNNTRPHGEPGFGWRTPRQVYFCLGHGQ